MRGTPPRAPVLGLLLVLLLACGGARAATEVSLELVTSGLGPIGALAHAGDSRLFVVELSGRVRIWDGTRLLPQPFLDIGDRVLDGGERGLFAIAFHPRHAENRRFFVHYTDLGGNTVVERLLVSAGDRDRADASSAVELLHVGQPFANHNGGALLFGPDGYLYLALGDGGSGGDPLCHAQRRDSLLGKILRLDVDAHDQSPPFYAIPPDNPFAGPGSFLDEVWAYGLRNPWRLSFDRSTGDLFIADVGQGSREEIDFEPASAPGGRNYGWNREEGSQCFSDACPDAPPCGDPSLVRPIVEYGHGGGDCSVTGGYVYRGQRHPALAGAYFYGDFCSGKLWLARRQGDRWVEELLAPRLPQLTSFGEDRDGELYLATLGGEVYRLVGPAAPPPPPAADRVGAYDAADQRFVLAAADGGEPAELELAAPAGRAIAGDWLETGNSRPGVYDPAAGRFHLDTDLDSGPAERSFRFGPRPSSWLPVAGDWNGDGRDTVGLWSPESSSFRLRNALAGGAADVVVSIPRRAGNWLPLAGDWDGDGRDEVGVFRPGDGVFRLKRCLAASCRELVVRFRPVPRRCLPLSGDWNGDGRDGIGVYDPVTAIFYLRETASAGPAQRVVELGPARAQPVAGNW